AARLTRRFSALGLVCVTALIVTGLVNAWFMVDSLESLVGTLYGRLLLLKIVLFGAMLGLAARNRWQLAPRIGGAAGAGAAAPAVRALARNALIEVVLGAAVILVVGLLAVTPPAHAPGSRETHHTH
ncbi:MAG: CopD family protein, partial [Proteobacteria bacterium]|nr:CopD family protein [Pseudomonadota bacterium]